MGGKIYRNQNGWIKEISSYSVGSDENKIKIVVRQTSGKYFVDLFVF